MADFLTIYIEESHAANPNHANKTRDKYSIEAHRSIDDRLTAARILSESRDSIPGAIAVDTLTDDANRAYGGLYERLYVVLDGRVVYAGGRGPHGYRVDEVQHWLQRYSDILTDKHT